ncbi:MAG: cbb3-type cytochrome c oxidase subunit 3 [Candidatus Sericytochromatia bacterium]|nr:cbb3-type cytochrome c oxidase subunit 3 [Candidatus Tanganyikabacteria bacterium]
MDVYVFGKLAPLLLFSAMFVGVTVWALWAISPERIAHMANIPLREDDDVAA